MENEHLHEEAKPKEEGVEGQKVDADDLKFIRSALEKACRQIKPKTSNTIMWGLICMTGYVGVHFLIENQLFNWIRPLQISLICFGVIISMIQGHSLFIKFKHEGFIPQQLMTSLFYGVVIIVLPVFIFDFIGLFKGMYCGSAFIYALMISTFIAIMGMSHSKLWFVGSIFIITGMLIAFIIKEYSFIILGITTGTGVILAALIVDLNYRKQEEESA